MAYPLQLGFQDAASPVIEELLCFHDHAIIIVFLISTFVLYVILAIVTTKLTDKFILDSQEIETIWTLIPALTLVFIALPSIEILYIIDEINRPWLTIKAIGHQWYWTYEYSEGYDAIFDSYIIPTQELLPGQFRLLEADRRIVIPAETPVRILVSADDVLHSWAVPSLGIKVDAVPGRLNQIGLTVDRTGVFYGQCSEICGANHSFMPIVVEALPLKNFEELLPPVIFASLRSYKDKL